MKKGISGAARQAKYRDKQATKGRIPDTYFLSKKIRAAIRREAKSRGLTTGEVVEIAFIKGVLEVRKEKAISPAVISDALIQIKNPNTGLFVIVNSSSGKVIRHKKSPGPFLMPKNIPIVDLDQKPKKPKSKQKKVGIDFKKSKK